MADINQDFLDQLPQYKSGVTDLTTALQTLSKSIADNTDKFTKLNAQNKETVNWGTKIKGTVKDLTDTYSSFKSAITIASEAFEGWAGIAAAAFTLITTYGPQVLDFMGNMFKSDKVKEAAENLKLYNGVMETYIDKASGGLAKVNTLVGVVSEKNQFHSIRVEALKELINLQPEALKNLTLENIATKDGKAMIDEYVKSLKRKSLEEAAQAQSQPLIKSLESLKPQLARAKQLWEDYQSGKIKDIVTVAQAYTGPGMQPAMSQNSTKIDAQNAYLNILDKYKKLSSQISTISKQTNHELINLVANPLIKAQAKIRQLPIKTNVKPTRINGELETQQDSIQRMALLKMDGYAKEVTAANQHFDKLKEQHKGNAKTLELIEKERAATLNDIHNKFQKEDLDKLTSYQQQLSSISTEGVKTAKEQAFKQLEDENTQKQKVITDAETNAAKIVADIEQYKLASGKNLSQQQIDDLNTKSAQAVQIEKDAAAKRIAIDEKFKTD